MIYHSKRCILLFIVIKLQDRDEFLMMINQQIRNSMSSMYHSPSSQHLKQNKLTQHYHAQLLTLEGECKITEHLLLKANYLKGILLMIPITLSIIGLFLLKHRRNLRVPVFYDKVEHANQHQATHIYCKGRGKQDDQIVALDKQQGAFMYKKLKYSIIDGHPYPIGLNYEYELQHLPPQFKSTGLNQLQIAERTNLYGKNEHVVSAPLYFQYLYEVMTQPFFFIQYLAAFIYFADKLSTLAIMLIAGSVVTTSINYLLLYFSYRKIKNIAQTIINVRVLREGTFSEIDSRQLVPGDLFIAEGQVSCDCIVLQGSLYVNEANLTGESVPIGKTALHSKDTEQINDNSKWLFQGSRVMSANGEVLSMVVHTGYSSRRGRILRRILYRVPKTPYFFKTFVYFLGITYVVGVLVYLGTLPIRLNSTISGVMMFLTFLLYITFCFPPAFPIYFNLIYSFGLVRLRWQNILGTQPQKTVESAHLKTMCFDKTGTLTEDKMNIKEILQFKKAGFQEITDKINQNGTCQEIIAKIFATCHTVQQVDAGLVGDEIDLKMFKHSGFQLCKALNPQCKFAVKNQGNEIHALQVLKVFQYQSKFQSMSVLVKDTVSNKLYVFGKGAPQMLHGKSCVKYQYFDKLLQKSSYGGFRTIAFGYKQINPTQLQKYLYGSRDLYLLDLKCIGLILFQNHLKDSALPTIKLLSIANIQSKMITGDNVYIAMETGIRCGMLNRQDKIVVLQGKKQHIPADAAIQGCTFKGLHLKSNGQGFDLKQIDVPYGEYISENVSIVIDNDFLNLSESIPLPSSIKVFARISPENKALVVKKLKSGYHVQRSHLSWVARLFSKQISKVGMIGDGANDLLAIRQADIGIGIRNCDSSFAASFSVQELNDIDVIVRESKCVERQIIEVCRYFSVTSFLFIPMSIIMQTQGTFFTNFQLLFANLTKLLLYSFVIGLSRASPYPTAYRPCSNFLRLQNQLVYWGNVIIFSCGYAAVYLYLRNTSQYQFNPYPQVTFDSGYYGTNHLTTCLYMAFTFQPTALVIYIFESSPWKEVIVKNIILAFALFLNFAFGVVIYFLNNQLAGAFELVAISSQSIWIMFVIMMGVLVIGLIYNLIIYCLRLHQKQFEEDRKREIEMKGVHLRKIRASYSSMDA